MSKHTPGRWLARKGDVLNPDRPWGVVVLLSKEECISIDGNDSAFGERSSVIAEICDASTEGTPEADAKLMAAAPDMLAALKEAERVIRWAAQEAKGKVRREIVGGWLHHAQLINTTITKAEGRT